jgi:hypothetical protein
MDASAGTTAMKWGRKMPDRPTKRAIQQHIAAQAPDGWTPKEREKKRRKLADDEIPDLAKDPES